ncbi:MAG: hypothetical protein V9E94_05350 [Microthrixaceae bacterium]
MFLAMLLQADQPNLMAVEPPLGNVVVAAAGAGAVGQGVARESKLRGQLTATQRAGRNQLRPWRRRRHPKVARTNLAANDRVRASQAEVNSEEVSRAEVSGANQLRRSRRC